ncbi:MAG: HAMP domain-containing histidine kinase [Deltaproteobacteria bacterium]|nr:HAMP domain-containing histidine kinase [Deltaproteobacteria bacterium]
MNKIKNIINSIKFKFTLWYLMILGILLIMLAGGVYISLSQILHHNLDESLRRRAKQICNFREVISIVASGTFQEEVEELISFYFYSGKTLRDISHKGMIVPVSKQVIDLAIYGTSSFVTIEESPGRKFRLYATGYTPDDPFISPDKFRRSKSYLEEFEIRRSALVVARPVRDIDSTLDWLLHILLIAVPLTLICAGGGGVFLAGKAFKPVEQITNAAREIEEHDLNRRIIVKTKDELGHLADTLNQMIGRLEKAFNRQKQFTSDASHELRAPLAIIQAESTLALQKLRKPEAYQRSLELISQESDHMSGVINQLLTLARADAGNEQFTFETIPLQTFIRDIYSDMEILCREKVLQLDSSLPDPMTIKGDRKSLKRLMYNILSNAIRYTPSGGSIFITLQKEDAMAVVTVADTGIGIPSNDLPLIFERFYRVDKARSRSEGGSGLGLAICKYIVDIHGGRIEVESQVDKGSAFHIKLPLTTDR